ncbi:hypothetical protein COCON_G00084710 [Conger conger]|uniref:Uncharacterized protein n=1 Tax=Conger conger TaxID=82655 RepID=A0A9Q1DQG5_CONCO|nr:hypothetical protein COCON_G00084710 [Conger conger]
MPRGRVEEAEAILRGAAKKNRVKAPEVIFQPLQAEYQETLNHHNICDLIKSSSIRWITIKLILMWVIICLGYFALSLNTSNLSGDPFLNSFFSAAVEVPAYILAWPLFRSCPRRLCLSPTLFLSGVVLLVTQLIPGKLSSVSIALEMMGKFGFSVAYILVYAFTAELYPTVLRNTAVGTCSTISHLGNIAAPYFLYMGTYYKSLPYILMGSLCALGGLLGLLLPETYGLPLPETIDHMQTIQRIRIIFSTVGVCIFFAIGYMLLPLMAFFIRDWRMLLIAINVSGVFHFFLWWFIPESPRWLLSQGRVEEAEAILRGAAKENGVTAPEVIFQPLQVEGEKLSHHNICDFVKFVNIRWITVMLSFVWWVVAIGYFALSLNTSSLLGDHFLNCFFSAVVEVPAYILAWPLFRSFPRRLSVVPMLVFSGAVLLSTQLIPTMSCVNSSRIRIFCVRRSSNLPGLDRVRFRKFVCHASSVNHRVQWCEQSNSWMKHKKDLSSVSIALEMMGKFGVTVAFSILYPYTAELYPTVLRNTAIGICSMASQLGAIAAPYFLYLGTYYKSLPYIIMGTLSVLGGLLGFLLPETYGLPLPETIDHMQTIQRCKSRQTSNHLSSDSAAINNVSML